MTDSAEDFDYETADEILAEAECESSPAELQGILCGMIAAGLTSDDTTWLEVVVDVINENQPTTKEVIDLIHAVSEWTHHEMNLQESLAPTLLPDDNYPPVDQLEAVIMWAQGFLLGFGLQTGNQEIEDKEIREAITDIAEISQLALEADENEETREAIFTVIEHMKVAAQVVHWEMVIKPRSMTAVAQAPNETIH